MDNLIDHILHGFLTEHPVGLTPAMMETKEYGSIKYLIVMCANTCTTIIVPDDILILVHYCTRENMTIIVFCACFTQIMNINKEGRFQLSRV